MCGIQILKTNNGQLTHRGVSSYSIREKVPEGFYMIHDRLPIQTNFDDVREQPIKLRYGNYLLYNGEIYNFPKNRFNSDVEYLRYLFDNKTISEILYESNEWDGMWAIVFVKNSGLKFAFTDPLGKKQLYYNDEGEIASEIRPLVKDFNDFDPFFKSSVFKWGYNRDDRTPWNSVKRIIPNRLHTFGRLGSLISVEHKDYYKWHKFSNKNKSLRELLYKAVEERTISRNYQIGVLVSGGLDSSIISRILSDLKFPAYYYTIDNNEIEYARILGSFLGISVTPLTYEMGDNLKTIFKWNETPIDLGSVVPQHELFKVIPERVVLSGDGADELFGGYRRINEYDSQHSDIFEELTYYHLPRLDRASMRFTIELRNPFLSHDVIKYALRLPYKERINKKHLKDVFRRDLPNKIIDRAKLPLKNPKLVQDKDQYKKQIFQLFYNNINFNKNEVFQK